MEASTSPRTIYCFGPFQLDPIDRTLVCESKPVALQPRSFDVLLLLVSRAGALINKEQFRTEVWAGAVVTDNALTRCIRQLRSALADSTSSPAFIATVPRHGYRFVAQVSRTAIEEGTARGGATPLSSELPLLLALPFSVELQGEGAKYLSSEISEVIIDRLASSAELDVMASHSSQTLGRQSMPMASLASEFGVSYVISGSVRLVDDLVLVRAECVRTEDSVALWTERLQLPEAALANVAQQIAACVYQRLTGEKTTPLNKPAIDERAYNSFLLATAALKNSRFPKAVKHAERSLELASENAIAHTLLAQTFLTWANYGGRVPEPDPLIRSQRHLRMAKAVASSASGPQVQTLEAQLALYLERDYTKAIRLCNQLPRGSSVTAAFLFYGLRYDEGIRVQLGLAEKDPLNLQTLLFSQRMLRFIGDLEKADYYHQLCLDIDADYLMVLQDRFYIALYDHRIDEAAGLLDQILRQQDMPWWPHSLSRCWFGSKLQAYKGQLSEALALADELAEQPGLQPTLKAEAYFNARNLDGVYRWIDVGIREFDPGIYQMIAPFHVRTLSDPLMTAFVGDERHRKVRLRLGLEDSVSLDKSTAQVKDK